MLKKYTRKKDQKRYMFRRRRTVKQIKSIFNGILTTKKKLIILEKKKLNIIPTRGDRRYPKDNRTTSFLFQAPFMGLQKVIIYAALIAYGKKGSK